MKAKQHLAKHSQCSSLDPTELTRLAIAIGLAREKAKGAASAHYLTLKSFPKLHDFQSFYPRLAGPEILRDFKSLKFIDTIKEQQVTDNKLRQCFTIFQNQNSIPLVTLGVRWPDVQEASMQIRTRAYGNKKLLPDLSIVIPLADMMNTAPTSNWNARWELTPDMFTLKTDAGISADKELLESYCPLCDNRRMLSLWGIYLESNPKRGLSCSVQQASDQVLHNATMAVLESNKMVNWTAPRCKEAVFTTKQGPLRCSLARLAWEACSSQWAGNHTSIGNASSVVLLGDLKRSSSGRHVRRRRSTAIMNLISGEDLLHSKSARTGEDSSMKRATWEAALLDQSCRHQVHP